MNVIIRHFVADPRTPAAVQVVQLVVVPFGESANNEMCFFWAYYYPSQGAKIAMNTRQSSNAPPIATVG